MTSFFSSTLSDTVSASLLVSTEADHAHHVTMDTEVVVALIAAAAGLFTSGWTLHRQDASNRKLALLQNKFTQEAATQQRQFAAKEHLEKYREPLLATAGDLFHRIRNIREHGFLVYLRSNNEQRSRIALLGTLYRFGKYWAVVDELYRTVNILRFQTEEETRSVDLLLSEIGSTFASDQIDRDRLMVWREEQRAIAEMMRPDERADALAVIGFSSFVDKYPTRLESWLSALERDLRTEGIEGSKRLEKLQNLLGQLVEQLEAGRAYAA
ncbi:hypothetical protein [Corallococcus exiguus]|uniref:Uncharacterized protein n=1 Tax=Corallococcus exiguus TaxID=83462 RepID=A0A7X4YH82_9BACT|nr:hypothetical protein [Corallococcus exiguus]NBC45339.1 hypothetical protein [Corallococcus exiguus]RKH82634.1 hypothetical protein D7Y21_28065 [Corallococcus sp. AB045]TNV63069.1 hypothetical protein FH620_16255 [Corallococcus exiguus]